PSGSSIQRSEQLVSSICIRSYQPVEQGRLTGIGISHYGDRQNFCTFSRTPSYLTLPFELGQLLFQKFYTFRQQTTICLQLRFTRSAQTDTTLLAFEVSPSSHQPR